MTKLLGKLIQIKQNMLVSCHLIVMTSFLLKHAKYTYSECRQAHSCIMLYILGKVGQSLYCIAPAIKGVNHEDAL